MRDAIVKDLMRDAIVKNNLLKMDVDEVKSVVDTSLAGFIKSNEDKEHILEDEASALEAKAKKDLAKAAAIKKHMLEEEAAVAKAVNSSVAAWRKVWDSKQGETAE